MVVFAGYFRDLATLRRSRAMCEIRGNHVDRTLGRTLSPSNAGSRTIIPRFRIARSATSGSWSREQLLGRNAAPVRGESPPQTCLHCSPMPRTSFARMLVKFCQQRATTVLSLRDADLFRNWLLDLLAARVPPPVTERDYDWHEIAHASGVDHADLQRAGFILAPGLDALRRELARRGHVTVKRAAARRASSGSERARCSVVLSGSMLRRADAALRQSPLSSFPRATAGPGPTRPRSPMRSIFTCAATATPRCISPVSLKRARLKSAASALASLSASSASRPTASRNSGQPRRVADRLHRYPALAGGNGHGGRSDPDRRRDLSDYRRTDGRCARAGVSLRGRTGVGEIGRFLVKTF